MPKTYGDGASEKLLKHLREYGVLICKSCQFAIQPSALSSHLLRHQIYRNERRQLLERLQGLDLREPDGVTYPSPKSPAILELPVYRGWICGSAGCVHACASEKRMAQHWSDHHGSRDVVARTAWLQTFFRGNKIRYFEVSEPANAPTPLTDSDDEPAMPSAEPRLSGSITSSSGNSPFSTVISDDASSAVTSVQASFSTQYTPSQLNMLNLQLMHHWSTATSYTVGRGTESLDFWTNHITNEALNGNDSLMYFCLSTAAFHLASEHRSSPKFHDYRAIALEYQGAGLSHFRKLLEQPYVNQEANLAVNRLLSVTRCAEHHLDPESMDSAIKPELEGQLLPVLECIMLLRGSTELCLKIQNELPENSGLKLPDEVLVGLLEIPYNSDVVHHAFSMQGSRYPNIPSDLYRALLSIPPLLQPLLRQFSSADMHAFKHGFTSLITCFDRSYLRHGTDELWSLWNGVEAWPHMMSDRFLDMLQNTHPATTVLLAMWGLVVKRLEAHCWFLQGETRRIFRFTRDMVGDELKGVIDGIAGFPT